MKKFIVLLIISCSLLFNNAVRAQQDTTRLSLQTALESAIKQRDEIKIQVVNAANSANEISKAGSKLLPQLTSDLDLRYNSQLQTNVLPGNIFGQAGAPDKRVKFGTGYNTILAFNLTVPVYNPSDISDRKIARTQAAYDHMNIQKTEIDIRQQVTESYFSGLINKEKLNLSKINLDNTKAVYEMGKAQLKQGAITSYDLQKNRIDFENAQSDYTKSRNSYLLSLTDIAYQIGADTTLRIVLTDRLSDLYKQYQTLPAGNQLNRVELKMQAIQEDIYTANIQKQNRGYIPTFSIYSYYAAQNLNNSFTPFNGAYWYPYNYVGFKASIPIFDGLLKERTKKGYKLQYESARLTMDKLNRDYHQDVSNAETLLRNAQQDLGNQQNNLKLAQELYDLDADRYHKGTIRPTDLAATYYTLQQTQTNYLNAMYSYLLAVVQYKKAWGSL